jgi:hypothetical protein
MGQSINLLMILFFLGCLIILLIFLPIIIIRGLKQWKSCQFSLKALLMFVALCAVWISQFTRPPINNIRETFEWRNDFVVIFVWIVLAAFYLYRRLKFPLALHCVGIIFYSLLLVFQLISTGEFQPVKAGWLICVGCFFGSLISYPTWILVLCGFMSQSEQELSANEKDAQKKDLNSEKNSGDSLNYTSRSNSSFVISQSAKNFRNNHAG